jgi:hypothetical protein
VATHRRLACHEAAEAAAHDHDSVGSVNRATTTLSFVTCHALIVAGRLA